MKHLNGYLATGVWLLASLNSHETTKGMRVKFQDVECYRDYQYEYEYDVPKSIFNIWKPNNITNNKKEEKENHVTKTKEPDYYTDNYAEELGLRSLKNQLGGSDVEKLDLSFFDYDAIDVPLGSMDISLNFKETKNNTGLASKLDAMNNIHFSNWNKMDDNLTESFLLDNSFSGNVEHTQKNSTKNTFDHSFMHQTEDTFFSDKNVLLQNNITSSTNKTHSVTVSNFDNVTFFDSTQQNVTVFGNGTSDGFTAALQESKNNSITIQQITLKTTEIKETLNLIIPLQEITELPVTVAENSTFISKSDIMNSSLSGDSYASIDINFEDSEKEVKRGDVFIYSVPLSKPSNATINATIKATIKSNISEITFSQNATREDCNETATKHFNMSAVDESNDLSMKALDIKKVNTSCIVRNNMTIFELEVANITVNETNTLNTATQQFYESQVNSDKVVSVPANSSLENTTHILFSNGLLKNDWVNVSRSDLLGWATEKSHNSGVLTVPVNSSLKNATQILPQNESLKNVTDNVTRSDSLRRSTEERMVATAFLDEMTNTSSVQSYSSETVGLSNISLPVSILKLVTSDELGALDSSEELYIYHKENRTEAIKTSSIRPQGHNWTYDGTHSVVPQQIPDDMKKYFETKVPQTTPPPKKSKKIILRQRPQKGQGMKTRRRKEYQPQARSGFPFSPQGFNPGMTPRGSRPSLPQPVSDEEELINMPVVIGVPRPDFSEYDLYSGDRKDHLDMNQPDVSQNEYEYVMYKDPYSSHEDVKNLNLDETSKHYQKLSGPNVKTYFIAAEEVEWDYAGYGHR